ncbi:hypothetical protein GCM10027052_04400 [Parafrigoribacterium mesophilum]
MAPGAPVRPLDAPNWVQRIAKNVDKQVRLSPDLCYCSCDGPDSSLKAFNENTSNTSSNNTGTANPNLAVRKKSGFPPSPASYPHGFVDN